MFVILYDLSKGRFFSTEYVVKCLFIIKRGELSISTAFTNYLHRACQR